MFSRIFLSEKRKNWSAKHLLTKNTGNFEILFFIFNKLWHTNNVR